MVDRKDFVFNHFTLATIFHQRCVAGPATVRDLFSNPRSTKKKKKRETKGKALHCCVSYGAQTSREKKTAREPTLSNLRVFPPTSTVSADVNTPCPRKMCFTKSREYRATESCCQQDRKKTKFNKRTSANSGRSGVGVLFLCMT